VINLSLGSDERSQLLEQKLQQAKQLGIACIVAAGNSGGPVQYPASSPNVLAVAAIGKQGTFPADTYHSMQIFSDGMASAAGGDGYFSARFSCFGPEIGVCGPGVAILSSVPPDNYLAMDGTSMAAPHITGLAALILAHHPDFQGLYKTRTAARVDRLFTILKQCAQPPLTTNVQRIGAGLPDALRAFQLTATPATGPLPPATGQVDVNEWVRNLLLALQQASTGNSANVAPASVAPASAASAPGSSSSASAATPPPVQVSPQTVEDSLKASLVITAALRQAGIV
jgi:subtilisin family serine protease